MFKERTLTSEIVVNPLKFSASAMETVRSTAVA